MQRVYVEPIVFYLSFTNTEYGIAPRQLFEKAKQKKLELFTSIWTLPQYIGAINELYVKGNLTDDQRRDYVLQLRYLEMDLGDSLTKVFPEPEVAQVCIAYILERSVDYERSWHLATAKLSKCDAYVMVDQYMDLNKKSWEREFEIFNLIEKNDGEKLSKKLSEI